MPKKDQIHSRSGSFRARAMATVVQKNEALLGYHSTASLPSEKQVAVVKENTGSDFPPGMACTSHNHYG